MKESRNDPRRWIRFAFAFLIANYIGFSLLYQAGELPVFRRYASTVGQVIRTDVEEQMFAAGGTSATPPMEGTRWCPRVEYQYEVNGQVYRSHRLQPKVHCQSRQSAEAIVANYPMGRQVQVWYAVNDPHYAVLDKSIQPMVFVYYGGIILLWLMGNLLAFRQLTTSERGRRKERRQS